MDRRVLREEPPLLTFACARKARETLLTTPPHQVHNKGVAGVLREVALKATAAHQSLEIAGPGDALGADPRQGQG